MKRVHRDGPKRPLISVERPVDATDKVVGRGVSMLPHLAAQSEIEVAVPRRGGSQRRRILAVLTRWLRTLAGMNLPSFEIAVFAALALLAAANL